MNSLQGYQKKQENDSKFGSKAQTVLNSLWLVILMSFLIVGWKQIQPLKVNFAHSAF